MVSFFSIFLSFSVLSLVSALPTQLYQRTATLVPASHITALSPYTQFARAAYCNPSVIKTWTCGGKRMHSHSPDNQSK